MSTFERFHADAQVLRRAGRAGPRRSVSVAVARCSRLVPTLLAAACTGPWAQTPGTTPPPGPALAVTAAPEGTPQLQLTEAFVELHTGPGRGYPVTHVAARGEVVQLLLAHTAWVKLRTAGGREGWARRDALHGTLQAAGVAPGGWQRWVDATLRDKLSFGAAWGRFQSQPMLQLGTRLRLSDAIHVAVTAGQVQGLYSGTDFWRVDALVEPLVYQAWSPRLAVGVGRFRNVPNASLVEQGTTHANLAHAGIGVRWRFGARYELQADYSLYTALLSDQRSREYRALTLGLSFHF